MKGYYMIHRPVSPGAQPVCFERFENYDGMKYIPEIGRTAYAKVWYARELTDEEIHQYELIPEEFSIRLSLAEIELIKRGMSSLVDSHPELDDDAYSVYSKLDLMTMDY